MVIAAKGESSTMNMLKRNSLIFDMTSISDGWDGAHTNTSDAHTEASIFGVCTSRMKTI